MYNTYNSLIIDSISAMVELAKEKECLVRHDSLNGVDLTVNAETNVDWAFRDQQRAQSNYIDNQIGPYFKEHLTEEELASDAVKMEEARKRSEEQQKVWAEKQRIKSEKLQKRLDSAPEFEFSDKEEYEKGVAAQEGDGYGLACFTYANKWGRLMQLEMENGKNLADIAQTTSHEANDEGITGAMYGMAVIILTKCWVHGEELRRWHNIDTQIGDEGYKANENGGVLSSALLTIND